MNTLNLNLIQSVMDDATKSNYVAGMNCLIVQNNKELGYWQSGYADIEKNKLFSRNTICRMYSMTKPVTACAAMILVQEGKLDLGEPLGNYIPAFYNLQISRENGRDGKIEKASRNILIKDLLNMTSGYTYGAWSENAPCGELLTSDLINELNIDAAGNSKISTMDVAERLARIPVSFEPGTDYQYGLSADILGAVIEKVSGMKFSEFLKSRIFDPLKMNDTGFYVPSEKQDRLSKVYKCERKDGKYMLTLFTNCNLGIQDKMDHAPSFESGGAGLCSTVEDYMRFASMLANKGELDGVRILNESTVDYLASAKLIDNLQKCFDNKMEHLSGYTYANLLRVAIDKGKCTAITENGEFGWDGWLGPYVSVDLRNNLAVVITMQRTDSGTTEPTRKIKNIIYSSL